VTRPAWWRLHRRAPTTTCAARAEGRVLGLVCDRCGDATLLETDVVVMEAQVITFVDAHCVHDGHAVRVRMRPRPLS
jgi:hypothetical protein